MEIPNTGPLRRQNNNFYLDISRGRIKDVSSVFKFGRHPSVGAAEEVVWDGEGTYIFLEEAKTMNVVSTSIADNPAGIGASEIVIFGLDQDKKEIQEVITLNGQTPVTTIKEFLRIHRALVLTTGTGLIIGDANIGDISISTSDTAILQAKMLAGNGQTLMAVYTIPAGKTGYVTGIGASTPEGKSCLMKAKIRNGPTSDYAFTVKYTIDLFEQALIQELVVPLRVPEKTDLAFTASSTAVGTAISASFGIILIDNEAEDPFN